MTSSPRSTRRTSLRRVLCAHCNHDAVGVVTGPNGTVPICQRCANNNGLSGRLKRFTGATS